MLKVRFLEVTRAAGRDLGINWYVAKAAVTAASHRARRADTGRPEPAGDAWRHSAVPALRRLPAAHRCRSASPLPISSTTAHQSRPDDQRAGNKGARSQPRRARSGGAVRRYRQLHCRRRNSGSGGAALRPARFRSSTSNTSRSACSSPSRRPCSMTASSICAWRRQSASSISPTPSPSKASRSRL